MLNPPSHCSSSSVCATRIWHHSTSIILHLSSQVKSFILFADISKGVYFLQWKEEGALLTLLSRDPTPQQPTAADFLIDGPNLGIVAGDCTTSMQVGPCMGDKP